MSTREVDIAAIRERHERAPRGPYLARPLSMGGYHLAAAGRVLGTVRDEMVREFFEHAHADMGALLQCAVEQATRIADLERRLNDATITEFTDEIEQAQCDEPKETHQ